MIIFQDDFSSCSVFELVAMDSSDRKQKITSSLFISANKNNVFTQLLLQHTGLFLAGGILCLADIPASKKFAYTTLTNSLRSRLCFILNWDVRAVMFFFSLSLSLSDIPFILHARNKRSPLAIQGKLSSLLQSYRSDLENVKYIPWKSVRPFHQTKGILGMTQNFIQWW